jgi:hypothetical protein
MHLDTSDAAEAKRLHPAGASSVAMMRAKVRDSARDFKIIVIEQGRVFPCCRPDRSGDATAGAVT